MLIECEKNVAKRFLLLKQRRDVPSSKIIDATTNAIELVIYRLVQISLNMSECKQSREESKAERRANVSFLLYKCV